MLAVRVVLGALTRPPRHRYGPAHPQVADLHVPAGDGPFPVAVVLHGGYWRTQYGRLTTRPLARDLARRGIAAWNLEYRRLGHGRNGGGGWPATFDDVREGIAALATLDDPRLDLADVTAIGHSAGGQLALFAAAESAAAPRIAIRRAIALAPVTDLVAAGAPARELLGGRAQEVPDRYALADPVRRAPLPLPVLIVHPADDDTVPLARSRAYAARGGDVTLLAPATGGHRAPIDPDSDVWRTAADWLSSEIEVKASQEPEVRSRVE